MSNIKPITILAEKYTSCGWNVIKPNKSTQNDLIAQGPNKTIHFIQLIEENDIRSSGIPHSTFVQNAISNGAIPIHAIVINKNNNIKIKLSDENTNSKVILRSKTKQPATVENKQQTPKASKPQELAKKPTKIK